MIVEEENVAAVEKDIGIEENGRAAADEAKDTSVGMVEEGRDAASETDGKDFGIGEEE